MRTALEPLTSLPHWVYFTLDLERRYQRAGESNVGMRVLKVLTSLLVMILAACAIVALWRAPLVLTGALCVLAFLKRLLFPIRFEVLWFVVVGYMGAYAESLIAQTGGAWSYAQPQFGGIPIWLPAIWGLTATALLTAYSAISERDEPQPQNESHASISGTSSRAVESIVELCDK